MAPPTGVLTSSTSSPANMSLATPQTVTIEACTPGEKVHVFLSRDQADTYLREKPRVYSHLICNFDGESYAIPEAKKDLWNLARGANVYSDLQMMRNQVLVQASKVLDARSEVDRSKMLQARIAQEIETYGKVDVWQLESVHLSEGVGGAFFTFGLGTGIASRVYTGLGSRVFPEATLQNMLRRRLATMPAELAASMCSTPWQEGGLPLGKQFVRNRLAFYGGSAAVLGLIMGGEYLSEASSQVDFSQLRQDLERIPESNWPPLFPEKPFTEMSLEELRVSIDPLQKHLEKALREKETEQNKLRNIERGLMVAWGVPRDQADQIPDELLALKLDLLREKKKQDRESGWVQAKAWGIRTLGAAVGFGIHAHFMGLDFPFLPGTRRLNTWANEPLAPQQQAVEQMVAAALAAHCAAQKQTAEQTKPAETKAPQESRILEWGSAGLLGTLATYVGRETLKRTATQLAVYTVEYVSAGLATTIGVVGCAFGVVFLYKNSTFSSVDPNGQKA